MTYFSLCLFLSFKSSLQHQFLSFLIFLHHVLTGILLNLRSHAFHICLGHCFHTVNHSIQSSKLPYNIAVPLTYPNQHKQTISLLAVSSNEVSRFTGRRSKGRRVRIVFAEDDAARVNTTRPVACVRRRGKGGDVLWSSRGFSAVRDALLAIKPVRAGGNYLFICKCHKIKVTYRNRFALNSRQ